MLFFEFIYLRVNKWIIIYLKIYYEKNTTDTYDEI